MLHKARQSRSVPPSGHCLPPSAGAQTTLTMSSWVPDHHLTRVVLEGLPRVAKASAGRVTFEMPKHPVAAAATFDARDGSGCLIHNDYAGPPAAAAGRRVSRAGKPPKSPPSPITACTGVIFTRRRIQRRSPARRVHPRPRIVQHKAPHRALADLQGMKLAPAGVAEAVARALGASVVVNPVNQCPDGQSRLRMQGPRTACCFRKTRSSAGLAEW
jgi:hypothetical protein